MKKFFSVYRCPLKFLSLGYTAGKAKSSNLIETDSLTMASCHFFQVTLWSITCCVVYAQVCWFAAWLVLAALLSIVLIWFLILHRSWQYHWQSPWILWVSSNVLRDMLSDVHILKTRLNHRHIYLDFQWK